MYYTTSVTDCLTDCQVEFIRDLLNISYNAYNTYYNPKSSHMEKANSVKEVEWVKATIYGFIEGLYYAECISQIDRNRIMSKCVLDNRVFNDESLKNFKFLRNFS